MFDQPEFEDLLAHALDMIDGLRAEREVPLWERPLRTAEAPRGSRSAVCRRSPQRSGASTIAAAVRTLAETEHAARSVAAPRR